MRRRNFIKRAGLVVATTAVLPSAIARDGKEVYLYAPPEPPEECYLMVLRSNEDTSLFLNMNAIQHNGTKFIKTEDVMSNIAYGWMNGIVEYKNGYNSVHIGDNMFVVDDSCAKILQSNYEEAYLRITRKTTTIINGDMVVSKTG